MFWASDRGTVHSAERAPTCWALQQGAVPRSSGGLPELCASSRPQRQQFQGLHQTRAWLESPGTALAAAARWPLQAPAPAAPMPRLPVHLLSHSQAPALPLFAAAAAAGDVQDYVEPAYASRYIAEAFSKYE